MLWCSSHQQSQWTIHLWPDTCCQVTHTAPPPAPENDLQVPLVFETIPREGPPILTHSSLIASIQLRGAGNGQGNLACCRPWGRKESDRTERLNWVCIENSPCAGQHAEHFTGIIIIRLHKNSLKLRLAIIYPYFRAKETEAWRISVAYSGSPDGQWWHLCFLSKSICFWCSTFEFETPPLTPSAVPTQVHRMGCLPLYTLAHRPHLSATGTSLALGLTAYHHLPWEALGLAQGLSHPLCPCRG